MLYLTEFAMRQLDLDRIYANDPWLFDVAVTLTKHQRLLPAIRFDIYDFPDLTAMQKGYGLKLKKLTRSGMKRFQPLSSFELYAGCLRWLAWASDPIGSMRYHFKAWDATPRTHAALLDAVVLHVLGDDSELRLRSGTGSVAGLGTAGLSPCTSF